MDEQMTPQEVIAKVTALAQGMSRPVYRGQANAKWDLRSGAVYRLQKIYGESVLDDRNNLRKLVDDYHRNLLNLMQVIDGKELSDLQRLSMLQHYGAATGFLDFTENVLVALWFACEDIDQEDGKIFILDIGVPEIAINGRNLSDENFFRTEGLLYYEPDRSLGTRIVAQQSILVYCNPPPDYTKTALVPKDIKNSTRDYLKKLGLRETFLFGDIPGLAVANARHRSLSREKALTPEQYRDRGNRAYQEERYGDALSYYAIFADRRPDVAEPYCLKGDSLAALGRFQEAIEAYTEAIARIDTPMDLEQGVTMLWESVGRVMLHRLYFNRGNAQSVIDNHTQAISDYDSALEHGSELKRNILFNRGNSKYALSRFDEAFADFEMAWSERQGSDIALALGNCKIMTKSFSEALQQYLEGIRVADPENSAVHCRQNAEQLGQILNVLSGQDYKVRRERHAITVDVEATFSPVALQSFSFAGNRGNAGNTPSGMVSARGGKGYVGGPGFSVVVAPVSD